MATNISGTAIPVAGQGLFSTGGSSTSLNSVGGIVFTEDGRRLRYIQAGSSNLSKGTLAQAPAEIANHQNLTSAVNAIRSSSIAMTLGATAVNVNQYAGGFAVITTGTGAGYSYLISSNPAASASASIVIVLSDPLEVALDSTSRVDLIPNICAGVIVNPITATSVVVGVVADDITATNYGWVVTGGNVAILADGAITAGTSLVASNAVIGAVEAGIDATDTQQLVGRAVTSIATGEYGLVSVNIN